MGARRRRGKITSCWAKYVRLSPAPASSAASSFSFFSSFLFFFSLVSSFIRMNQAASIRMDYHHQTLLQTQQHLLHHLATLMDMSFSPLCLKQHVKSHILNDNTFSA